MDRLAEKNKGMGSLTVAKDGNVLYSHSFGYSYVSGTEKKPATAATKYRIASITKTYTAVMVFQLVEEGKLKLSDTLDRFFPQIPNAKKITIAHMLGHRSGIPDMAARRFVGDAAKNNGGSGGPDRPGPASFRAGRQTSVQQRGLYPSGSNR